MNQIKLYTWLAYLGTFPFVLSATLISLDIQKLIILGDLVFVANSYALVIVVFMSGIHWGNYLSDKQSSTINLLLTSNAITIFSWLAFLTLPLPFVFVFYCIAFFLLLLIDMKLFSHNVITKHYLVTRCMVTCIVITSLLLIVVSLTN